MLRGLATVSFWANDVVVARQWYTELLGTQPYFQRPDAKNPSYVEFRIGDFQQELGIIDRRFAPAGASTETGGAVIFWHVDDVEAPLERVTEMGATEYEPLIHREVGFVTASVVDPFGNVLGLMYNPNYLEVIASMDKR